jgi:hypothetical protein
MIYKKYDLEEIEIDGRQFSAIVEISFCHVNGIEIHDWHEIIDWTEIDKLDSEGSHLPESYFRNEAYAIKGWPSAQLQALLAPFAFAAVEADEDRPI